MNTVDSKTLSQRPGLVASLAAGFDSITNHITIILFPIGVDLLIWLGPRVQIKGLLTSYFQRLESMPGWEASQSDQMIVMMREFLTEQFNLMIMLRSFPVGVPSLMAGRSPINALFGEPYAFEIDTIVGVLAFWFVVTLTGLLLGTLYFQIVSQVALQRKVQLQSIITDWSKAFIQVVALTVLWGAILFTLSLPSSCMISFLMMAGGIVGQFVFMVYICLLFWMIFPLAFSVHGIFTYGHNILAAMAQSFRLTRYSVPFTGLFLLIVLLISQGLDIVWNIPADDSWLLIIGIVGHAFVVSSLLAGSFIYYRDTSQWIQQLMAKPAV